MSQTLHREPGELGREEMSMHRRILEALAEGPKTVPQVAEALALPATAVMVWMMGMRRYGLIVEGAEPNDEDYYEYAIVPQVEEVAS